MKKDCSKIQKENVNQSEIIHDLESTLPIIDNYISENMLQLTRTIYSKNVRYLEKN